MTKPEELARQEIDAQLERAGWVIQDRNQMNLAAGEGPVKGVAVREFNLASGHGFADYLLFVDGQAVGVFEAKPAGHTLSGVEPQALRYAEGLPQELTAPVRPMPFLYLGTGAETTFTNLLDPKPRARRLFHVHKPETLAEWLGAPTLPAWAADRAGSEVAEALPPKLLGSYAEKPSSLRSRLQAMPPVDLPGLWENKVEAIGRLEESLAKNRPRALIQMATGSGKTLLAVTAAWRLIHFAGARRILFLVDRSNLGEQAQQAFEAYRIPTTNRKFTELYNVQRLTSNKIASSAKVVITTIQRLYAMLKGDEIEAEAEESSGFELTAEEGEPATVAYNPALPIELFDVIFIDECHRSIYSLWRQVLEYFDAYLIGLTATPAKHTYAFFRRNLVMEYSHEEAVADRVNVDFEVYRIRTKITQEGSTIEAQPGTVVKVRDRETRAERWEKPDEDVTYGAKDLDRGVVAPDQIRLIVQTFRDRLFSEIFTGREKVPKTLIFAKDDSHAEDIVRIVREEFDEGNAFCQKITYKATGGKPAELIRAFRNEYFPRIAVTVDMIATGTDIKPIEIVVFLREVKSRVFFEQMKGRGVRVIDSNELQSVTPDARSKTHFVLVDCVGITEGELSDSQPLERKKAVAFSKLLEHVAAGGTDPDMLSSLASRLARLDKQCGAKERERIAEVSGGVALSEITKGLIEALDPDRAVEAARETFQVPEGQEPIPEQVEQAAMDLRQKAAAPLAHQPDLRNLVKELKQQFEQWIDTESLDELTEAGFSEEAKERAKALVADFETFLDEHRDEIDALEFFYSQPYDRRLRFKDLKALADTIQAPPRSWTPERLWRAYATLEKDHVRGASGERLLTDLVSLVRFALHRDQELAPYTERVRARFDHWMAEQANRGRSFTGEQIRWLTMIRDHIAGSLEMELEDFELTPFAEEGGLGRARAVFGAELPEILKELGEELVA